MVPSRWLALLFASSVGKAAPLTPGASPTVDLGYVIQEGIFEADHGEVRYFNFTNVRYAAPPTGPNRFKPPLEPVNHRPTAAQTAGTYGVICPQAQPAWLNFVASDIGNLTDLPSLSIGDLPLPDPGSSEDCLFLDVLVPESVFAARPKPIAPVLVFIHGGGFVQGSKSAYGSGVGLLNAAALNKRDVIYVSINYRLGLFGFLAGTDSPDSIPNLGLLDQAHALRWVQNYIHLFGGDKDSVTVMGESAGAGSVMYHLTSPETSPPTLFHRAIVQSPYTVQISESEQQNTFHKVLQAANASSFATLLEMPGQALHIANALVVSNARPYGTFVFGPVTHGNRYPDYPPALLANEQYDRSVQIMAGFNANEGLLFASPFISSDTGFDSELSLLFPQASASVRTAIAQTLYPSDFSGKYGYVDQRGRIAQMIADSSIVCNAYFLDKAAEAAEASFLYQFSVPPAWHAADLSYTFMDPRPESTSGVNVTLARIFQRYMTNFAATGSTSSGTQLPDFATGQGLAVQNINNTKLGPLVDSAISVKRCDWWQKALFM